MNELTKQQIKKYKTDRAVIVQTRLSDLKTIQFRSNLAFSQVNLILKKEQLVGIPLMKEVSAEKIKYSTKSYQMKE